MATFAISLIICTRNPRPAYFTRTLSALRAQTLPLDQWQLIVVDNGSEPPLPGDFDWSWHPAATVVVESQPGFTPALIRGVAEARGTICVLVHDDNLLVPTYLSDVLRLSREHPRLGAWAGHYEPEYEEAPDPRLAPFVAYLAVHSIERDCWSDQLYAHSATPCGAGMAVRTDVLRHYTTVTSQDARRRSLGRHTDKLTSCEDFDIAFTAIDLGYQMGVFTCLRIKHLIPRARVQLDYLRRLVEGHGYSNLILYSFRPGFTPQRRGLLAELRRWRYLRSLPPVEREVQEALARGEARAYALLARQS